MPKIELTGSLAPEEAMKIIREYLENKTGRKVQACYGKASMRANNTPYGADSYPEFTGVEFRFVEEEV